MPIPGVLSHTLGRMVFNIIPGILSLFLVIHNVVHFLLVRGDPVLNPTFNQGLGTELGTSEFSLVCTYIVCTLVLGKGGPSSYP